MPVSAQSEEFRECGTLFLWHKFKDTGWKEIQQDTTKSHFDKLNVTTIMLCQSELIEDDSE